MRSTEFKVSPQSDYYVYTPSALARKLYLYPLLTGYFIYEPGYFIERNHFDNFLIMYISKGTCTVSAGSQSYTASAGQFVLLDCYHPHSYGSEDSWEAVWLHFDGPLARAYHDEILSECGPVIAPAHPEVPGGLLSRIYEIFRTSSPLEEHALSDYITRILNSLLFSGQSKKRSALRTSSITDTITYINEHFHESLTLTTLAKQANVSPYHFTRIFAKETGMTPHHYLIATRISAAKFLLKSSGTSIKEIAFRTGFQSETSFCNTFKKWEGCTPGQYRESGTLSSSPSAHKNRE